MESVNYRSLWVFYAYSSSYIKDKVNGIFEIYIISILLSFKITDIQPLFGLRHRECQLFS